MRWGLTYQERHQRELAQEVALATPHQWFAWHPVQLDSDRWVWLEDVTRVRRTSTLADEIPDWPAFFWTYS